MPAAPIQPTAGLPSLTSSELYTQTLAAQADVLVAAKAWPLLTKSLSDLTDIPGRHQLAIVMPQALYHRRCLKQKLARQQQPQLARRQFLPLLARVPAQSRESQQP